MVGEHLKIIVILLMVMLCIPTSFANEENDTNRIYTEEEIMYMVMELNQTVVMSGACFANFSTIDFMAEYERNNSVEPRTFDINHNFSYDDLRDPNLFNESNNWRNYSEEIASNNTVVEFSTMDYSSIDSFKNIELSNGKNIFLNKNIYLTESEPFDWVILNKNIKMKIKGIEIQNVSEIYLTENEPFDCEISDDKIIMKIKGI